MENSTEAVLVEIKDHILIATINRPEARNAVNVDVHVRLGLALERAESDSAVRAVIITGSGSTAFCAGADLKMLARGEVIRPADKEQAAWGFAGMVQHPISKPIIAAVNGFALGGGTEIALASDIVIAAEHAQFGLPEVKRGQIASAGGAFRLTQQLPLKIAMEYLLTGESITASRALELGLVNRVVPAENLMDSALEFAAKIAGNAPLSISATKRIAMAIANGVVETDENGWRRTLTEARTIYASQDSREGARAFAEKRLPVWSGT